MQKVCKSKDGGLNDALKLARRVEYDGVVASAALELSGSWATTGTATHSSRFARAAQAKIFAPAAPSSF